MMAAGFYKVSVVWKYCADGKWVTCMQVGLIAYDSLKVQMYNLFADFYECNIRKAKNRYRCLRDQLPNLLPQGWA